MSSARMIAGSATGLAISASLGARAGQFPAAPRRLQGSWEAGAPPARRRFFSLPLRTLVRSDERSQGSRPQARQSLGRGGGPENKAAADVKRKSRERSAPETAILRGMLGSGSKVRVRSGKPADAVALARIFKEAWLLAYRGIIPHLHLESMVRQRSPEWWRDALKSGDSALVLEMAGTVAGYATIGNSRQRGPFQGEIYELYLDPLYQGLGLGEHLFEGCRYALDMRKLSGLIVWALLDNRAACDFYWRRGGRPIASAFTKIGGERLEKVAFAWR